MTRPKDLPSVLQSWANGTYSPGPSWGSTPQRAAPGASYLTPGVTLPAENANYLHGNAFDAAQAAINMAGQIPALNFSPLYSVGATGTAIAFSVIEQAWYLIQNSSITAYRSVDFGKTWTSFSLAVATAGGSTSADIAIDTAGNIVVFASATASQDATFTAYGVPTFTNRAAVFPGGQVGGIVYEPVSGNWVALGNATSAAAWVYTSSNRSTWTARTLPGTWTTTGSFNSTIGVGGGLIVAAYLTAGVASQFRTIRSSNGGVTWTNDQVVACNAGISLAGGSSSITRPVWSSTDSLWYIACHQLSPRKTQVFSSPDGITWTTAATLLTNDCNFAGLQVLGSLLVAWNEDGRLFASINQGVNWYRCGATPALSGSFNIPFIAAGNGILGISGTGVVASSRFGLPVTAA